MFFRPAASLIGFNTLFLKLKTVQIRTMLLSTLKYTNIWEKLKWSILHPYKSGRCTLKKILVRQWETGEVCNGKIRFRYLFQTHFWFIEDKFWSKLDQNWSVIGKSYFFVTDLVIFSSMPQNFFWVFLGLGRIAMIYRCILENSLFSKLSFLLSPKIPKLNFPVYFWKIKTKHFSRPYLTYLNFR